MQFSHKNQHDNRRRRALIDDTHDAPPKSRSRKRSAVEAPAEDAETTDQLMNRLYPDFPSENRRTRVTDLVPSGFLINALLLLIGVAMIAGLEALYHWMPQLAALTSDGRVATFDLDSEGSLAVWFSSGLLALASALAVLIYTIRRHRADDYNARYRVWLWAAACWLLMSIDETASLHEGFKEMVVHLTGRRIIGDGSLWWVMAYLLVLVPIGVRLFLDMRGSRIAQSALFLTAICFVAAVVTQLQWILPESGARGVMVEEGCEMLGDLMLFLSMSLHARYVLLEAEGKIAIEPRKAAKPKQDVPPEADDETANSRPKRRTPTVTTARRSRKNRAKEPEEDEYEHARATEANLDQKDTPSGTAQLRFDKAQQSGGRKKLSKAERKELRRQMRNEHR